jgi:hypothetical protein
MRDGSRRTCDLPCGDCRAPQSTPAFVTLNRGATSAKGCRAPRRSRPTPCGGHGHAFMTSTPYGGMTYMLAMDPQGQPREGELTNFYFYFFFRFKFFSYEYNSLSYLINILNPGLSSDANLSNMR